MASGINLDTPSSTDNCGISNISNNAPGVFPVGNTSVQWTATDNSGNTNTVSQTITISDNEKPKIIHNGDQSVDSDTSQCGATVSVSATANDNCGVENPGGTRSDGEPLTALYPVGTTTISWKVSDENGNTANPVTQTITVSDSEAPTLPTISNLENWSCGKTIPAPTAQDNCSGEIVGTTSDELVYETFGTKTITWTFTDDAGNTSTASQSIVIPEPTVNIPDINGNEYCNEALVPEINFSGNYLTDKRYEWFYTDVNNNNIDIGLASSGNGKIPAFTAKNNGSDIIEAIFTVIPFGNACEGSPVEFAIKIKPTPTITKPNDIVVCAGETVQQIKFPGASVSDTRREWVNDNTGIGLAASGRGNIAAFTAVNNTSTTQIATITLTPTANDCAGISETFTITVKPKPVVTQFPETQVYCNGEITEALPLESSVAGTTFDISGGAVISLSNRTNLTEIPSFSAITGSASITITPVVNGCTGEPVSYNITVNPTPSVSVIPASQQICSGDATSILLSGSAESFSWEILEKGNNVSGESAGTGNTIAQNLINSGTEPEVVKYKIIPEANGCTGTPITVEVTVNPIPDFTISLPECQTSIDLTDPTIKSSSFTGITYTYWTNAKATAQLQNPSEVGLGTYYIKGTTGEGCSVVEEVVVENIKPVLTSSLTPEDICSNTVFNYTPKSNIPKTTFTWSRAAVNGISNPADASTEENTNNPNEILNNITTSTIEVTYVYTLTSPNGCTNAQEVIVNVKPTPMLQQQDYPKELCSGDLFECSPQSTLAGINYQWERRDTNGNIESSGTGAIKERLNNDTENNIVFTYYYTLNNSSCQNTEEFRVPVTVIPTFQVEATASKTEICAGESIDLFSSTELTENVNKTLLSQNFSSLGNWTRDNAGNANWEVRNNQYVESNRYYLNSNSNVYNNSLYSPSFSTIGYTSLSINLEHYYDDVNFNWGDAAYVFYSIDNGQNWTILKVYETDQRAGSNFVSDQIDLREAIGYPNVKIKFNFFNGGNNRRGYQWRINNIEISGETRSAPEVEWSSNTNENWSSNEQNPTNISPGTTTVYTVKYTDPELECPGRASIEVVVRQPPIPTITANYCGDSKFIELISDNEYASYRWEANGEILGTSRTLEVDIAKTYTLAVTDDLGCEGTGYIGVSNELIVNGDFEDDVTGFYTEYRNKTNNGDLYPEGDFAVDTDAHAYHDNFYGNDHTTGNGNFMIINGHPGSGKVIWRQTIKNIQPNTNYYFNAWGMNINPSNPARLQFRVNGVNTGTIADLENAPKPTNNSQVNRENWVQFYSNPFWNSGSSTEAVLEIVNLETIRSGNDFALDDISFGTLEQIKFTIDPANNSILCEGEELELNANIEGGRFPITFEWTGPAGSDFSNTTTVNTVQEFNEAVTLKVPNITAEMAGIYTLEVTDFYGCTPQIGTTEVKVLEINAGDNKIMCSNEVGIQLNGIISGSDKGGTWSTNGSGTFSNTQALDAVYSHSTDDLKNGVTLSLTSNDPEATCTDEMLLNFNNAPEATISVTTVSCFGANDGTATVTVSQGTGTAPFTYEWKNGNETQTTQTATNLAPNPNGYEVTVTDANGCSVSLTSEAIEEPSALEIVQTTHTDVTCFGGADGSATLEVSGGFITGETPNYAFSLLDKDGNEVFTKNDSSAVFVVAKELSLLSAGVYTFTANTVSGCSLLSKNISIEQPEEIIVDAGEKINISECGVTSVQLNATPVDPELGTGMWSFTSSDGGSGSFENPNANTTTFYGDSDKNYTLSWTVTPNNGCTLNPAILDFNFPPSCSKLNFDGVDDYVDAGNNFSMGGKDFSIEVWVKPNAINGVNTIISKRIDGETNKGYDLILNNGAPSFRVKNKSVTSTKTITTNRWYHLAGVYTASKMSLYVDGMEVQTNTNNIPNSSGNLDTPFLIGATNSSTTAKETKDHFNGFIEELRIWQKPISKAQIRFFMNQRLVKNGSDVSGTVLDHSLDLPNAPQTIAWSNLLGYYQLLAENNLITDGFTDNLGSVGKTANGLLKNIQLMQENTAPLPYILNTNNKTWFTKSTWQLPSNFSGISKDFRILNVWDAPGSKGINDDIIEWNIVKLNGNSVKNNAGNNINLLALLDDGGTLTMNGVNNEKGSGLFITHYLELNGHIDLNGESQLIQTEGSLLAGTGVLTRDQQGTASSFNYNYWSSPVVSNSGNQSYSIASVMHDGTDKESPKKLDIGPSGNVTYADGGLTVPRKISGRWLYSFLGNSNEYSDWSYIGKDGRLAAGEGYTMKGTSGKAEVKDLQNYTFKGFPNNGNIKVDKIKPGQNYLLGNPYPSSISVNEFILENIKDSGGRNTKNLLNGAVYFWDHFGGNTHILQEYVGGYAVRNLIDGVPAISTDSRIDANGEKSNKRPGAYIPVAQGFFVNTTPDPQMGEVNSSDTGEIIFKNSQRSFKTERAGEGTSFFMQTRSAVNLARKVSEEKKDERSKIRLEFTSPTGYHREISVGVDVNTTAGFDLGYDAPLIDEGPEDMYWVIGESKYIIQGVPHFNLDQELPLGLTIAEEKEFTIELGELENLPDDVEIFVKDNSDTTFYDLRKDAFKASLPTGEYRDRYSIVFQDETEIEEEEEVDPESPKIDESTLNFHYQIDKRKLIIDNPELLEIKKVMIYSLTGQQVLRYDGIPIAKTTELKIEKTLSSAVYLVKIITTEGEHSKKVIIRND